MGKRIPQRTSVPNKELIKQHDLDIREVREDAASFPHTHERRERRSGLSTMSWSGKAGHNAAALKRNTVADYAGDVIVEGKSGVGDCKH